MIEQLLETQLFVGGDVKDLYLLITVLVGEFLGSADSDQNTRESMFAPQSFPRELTKHLFSLLSVVGGASIHNYFIVFILVFL